MKFPSVVAWLIVDATAQVATSTCFVHHTTFHSPLAATTPKETTAAVTLPRHSILHQATTAPDTPDGTVPRRPWLQTVAAATSFFLLDPQNAFAERTLATVTESYRRYVPRMKTGMAFLGQDVPRIIASGEGYDELIAEIVAERGTKISALKGTMRIFASAFSDSVITQTTRELQYATDRMTQELNQLATALQAKDQDAALERQTQAAYFAEVYAESVNVLIPRSLDPIPGPSGEIKKRFTAIHVGPYNGAF